MKPKMGLGLVTLNFHIQHQQWKVQIIPEMIGVKTIVKIFFKKNKVFYSFFLFRAELTKL